MARPTVQTDTVLDQLVAGKRELLEVRRRVEPIDAVMERAQAAERPVAFAPALRGPDVRVIAEIKRASPTAGLLDGSFDPVTRAGGYVRGGAAAISVLTEERRFLGDFSDLTAVHRGLSRETGDGRRPLLRKDFLFDPYQIYEARAAGADAVLLIVAILEQPVLCELLALAGSLALGTIVEVHDEAEAERAARSGAAVIGINNRDLRTFATSLDVTERVRPTLPVDCLVISESGIRDRGDVRRLARVGIDAILVGETLMRSADPTESLRGLTGIARSAPAAAAEQTAAAPLQAERP